MPKESSAGQPRRIGRVIAVNVGLIAAILLVAELVFGNWITGPHYSFLSIPRNTVRHFDTTHFYEGGGITTYTRDEHGFRGPYDDPSQIDMLVLGGSTTNELYITDGETWIDRLSERFRQAGRPMTIINAAVDGQSSVGHLKVFDLWFPNVKGLKAKFILVYVGINDTNIDDANAKDSDAMHARDSGRRFRHYVMNNSVLYNTFRQLRGALLARRHDLGHSPPDSKAVGWTPAELDDIPPLSPERLEAYARRLERLAGKIKDFGATPIFVTQLFGNVKKSNGRYMVLKLADGSTSGNAGSYYILDRFNAVTLQVCRKLEIPCVDMTRTFDPAVGDFYDYAHTTPRGSRRIGDILFDQLQKQLP